MFPASNNRPVFAGIVSAIRNLFCLLPIEVFIVLTASESSVLVAVVNIGAFVFIVVFNVETAAVNSASSVLPSNTISSCVLVYVVLLSALFDIVVPIVVKN